MASDDDEKGQPVIQCRENGPYIVKGVRNLTDARGGRVETKAVFALCRCGGSANKPFCDGTHSKIGFTSGRVADGPGGRRESYAGKRIAIHDNRSICAHAGICTDTLKAVWRLKEEPWIDPDGAEPAAIIETIRRCPSGALSYSLDGAQAAEAMSEPAIRVARDGPYNVTGGCAVDGADWADGALRTRFTLCRCGASKNKPFCDGSHWDAGFKDPAG